jgi:hypothetical protein
LEGPQHTKIGRTEMMQEQILTCQKLVFVSRSEPLQAAHPLSQSPQHAEIFKDHATTKPTRKLQEHDFKGEEAAANNSRAQVQRIVPPQKKKQETTEEPSESKKFSSAAIYAE